jgi:hypothetical protein
MVLQRGHIALSAFQLGGSLKTGKTGEKPGTEKPGTVTIYLHFLFLNR